MTVHHASPGEIIDVRPLGVGLGEAKSVALMRTEALEVIRMIILKGKKIPQHEAPGDITVQCLEGHILFTVGDQVKDMRAGDMLYLQANDPHSLEGIEDSSILLTISRAAIVSEHS